jgi:DNA-directed RNA polymerase specialized sigma24 family protein
MSTNIRHKIRQSIKPFRHERLFTTGWAGKMSFTQLYEELIPNLTRLLRYYRRPIAYLPDIIQEGFMRFWWDLCHEPDMLAQVDKGGALRLVLNRTRLPAFVRQSAEREVYLDDLASVSDDPDDFMIEGYEGRHYMGHSEFSQAVDLRLDFEQAIYQIAEKYQDHPIYLIALYYIITDVSLDDASSLAGHGGKKKSGWLTHVVKPIREELAEKLGIVISTNDSWKDRFINGDERPFWNVVDRFKAQEAYNMVEVICGLSNHENCRSMASRLDLPIHQVHMYRRKAHQSLRQAYHCSA